MQSRTLSLRSALQFAAMLSAAAAVASALGSYDARLDILAHFAPGYLVIGIAAAVHALLKKPGRAMLLVSALAAVLGAGNLMANEFLRSTGSMAPNGACGQIKIVQFNSQRTNSELSRVVSWLIDQDPDVVTISEARSDLRDTLLARTGWNVAGRKGSLMIFTRHRYIIMRRPPLPPQSELNYANASYPSPGGPIEIVTTHLSWPTSATYASQVRDLKSVVARLPRERMILTGDFNSTPWSGSLRRLDSELGLTRRDRSIATYPASLLGAPWPVPALPIDHVYAGPGWATVSVERGPWLGSDHYPLVVVLAPLRQPGTPGACERGM
jgi:endonuclease/exonuclease/phosphatase (EEP) superfamily protein YafD